MIVMPLRSGIVRLHNPLAFGQGLVEAFTHFIPLLIRWLGCIRGAAVFSFRSPVRRHTERGLTMGGKASLIPCDFGNDVQWLTRYFCVYRCDDRDRPFQGWADTRCARGAGHAGAALRGYAPTGPWHGS